MTPTATRATTRTGRLSKWLVVLILLGVSSYLALSARYVFIETRIHTHNEQTNQQHGSISPGVTSVSPNINSNNNNKNNNNNDRKITADADVLALHRIFSAVTNAKTSDVAVVTLQTNWLAHEWTNCTFKQPKVEYCAKHKYALLDESMYPSEYALKPRAWMRKKRGRFQKLQYLELILRARLPFKWLLWVDGDTAFLNHEYTVENRIEKARNVMKKSKDKDPMFVLATDFNGMNNGVWLVQNTPEAHAVMVDIFNGKVSVRHPQADQLSLMRYLQRNPDFATEEVWVLPERHQFEWQAYACHQRGKPWILHLAGFDMEKRKDLMKKRGLLCGAEYAGKKSAWERFFSHERQGGTK